MSLSGGWPIHSSNLWIVWLVDVQTSESQSNTHPPNLHWYVQLNGVVIRGIRSWLSSPCLLQSSKGQTTRSHWDVQLTGPVLNPVLPQLVWSGHLMKTRSVPQTLVSSGLTVLSALYNFCSRPTELLHTGFRISRQGTQSKTSPLHRVPAP